MYLLMAVIICLLLVNFILLYKVLDKVNTIKIYQYTNNLKMLGFIKRELGQTFLLIKQWNKVKTHKGEQK